MPKKLRNNPANEISDAAKRQGVKYWEAIRKKDPGRVIRVHNSTLARHEAYMQRCAKCRARMG